MPSRYVQAEDPMYDFQSIDLDFGEGRVFSAVKEIKYAQELSRKLVYGTGPKPIGKTLGQSKPSASAVFYRAEFERFKKDVMGGSGFARRRFQGIVKYSIPGEDIITDTLESCSLTKLAGGGASGDDPSEISFDLMPMNILWNGDDMVDVDVQAAA